MYTGKKTNTGGRLLLLKNILKDETFLLTYGDGLADINVKSLVNFHKKEKCVVTVTAVKPPGRFGVLKIKKSSVKKFQEKVDNKDVWINGCFFVFNKKIFEYLKNKNDSLESDALKKVAKRKKMNAYKLKKFWSPMDTLRDKNKLNEIWIKGKAPWKR